MPLLPPGWQIARDPATGKFYFYNTSTGVVQWEPPGICRLKGGPDASRVCPGRRIQLACAAAVEGM